ncbi:unnamed protein product [Closterium sp. NIES-53]
MCKRGQQGETANGESKGTQWAHDVSNTAWHGSGSSSIISKGQLARVNQLSPFSAAHQWWHGRDYRRGQVNRVFLMVMLLARHSSSLPPISLCRPLSCISSLLLISSAVGGAAFWQQHWSMRVHKNSMCFEDFSSGLDCEAGIVFAWWNQLEWPTGEELLVVSEGRARRKMKNKYARVDRLSRLVTLSGMVFPPPPSPP